MNFGGHFWTIAPNLRHRLLPAPAPASTPWSTTVDDPRLGPITLRGADRSGEDFYHAGADRGPRRRPARAQALAHYRRIHVGRLLARRPHDAALGARPRRPARAQRRQRVRPARPVRRLRRDRPAAALPLSRHVLTGLKDIYAAIVARGRAVPTPWSTIRRLTTIREWDRHAVVPRHGFAASTTTTAA
jgi:hypothetical protein